MDNIFNELQKYYKKYNINISYEFYQNILLMIIENYNDYYNGMMEHGKVMNKLFQNNIL